MAPRTKYARSGELSIAYQVVGDGPVDLVLAPPYVSHLEYAWEEPGYARYLRRLAAFSRLILFDKRGTGLSDRTAGIAPLADRMDDVRAVMDAVGSRQAVLCGLSESTPLSVLFAATYPERTLALILYGAYASEVRAPDYPWAPTESELAAAIDLRGRTIHDDWASGDDLTWLAPTRMHDSAFRNWFKTFQRLSASPGAVIALDRMNAVIDVRHVLPAIRVPTLVLHRSRIGDFVVQPARYVAAHIPGAQLIELPGVDYLPYVGDTDALVDEVEAFVTGVRPAKSVDTVLATVLSAEIVDEAGEALTLGDRRWGDLVDRFRALVDETVARWHGRLLVGNGASLVATFDGPSRAIHCAEAVHGVARDLGLALRSGLHTGECEVRGDAPRGVAVPLAGWIASQASRNEILVSSTVRDLVAGAGRRFVDRGVRVVSGGVGEWRLFAVLSDPILEQAPAPDIDGSRTARPALLSRREQDVLPLVARGLSNRQVAERLSISERTVESHVASILAKWHLTNRAQLAAAVGGGHPVPPFG